ncbi:hypothetical protein [Thermoanaerobacterium thermosaccharolyticum]|uniref:hypothetical protein n=1 Tax=Thermoanaerobacterium thermosaccharolyticum TaxID=1517 RepID=UPI003DA8FD40
MQYVSRILSRVIDIYPLFNTYKQDVINTIVIPFVEANQKGVYEITDGVFEIAEKVPNSKTNPFAISNCSIKIARKTRKVTRETVVIRGITVLAYSYIPYYQDRFIDTEL